MPLRYFDCPDGIRRPVEECLKKCPRPEGRCLSLPTLISISHQREWNGKPSTTQLINGTRLAYLQIKKDYAVKPFDRAFALLGTRHHTRLDKVAQKLNALSEEKLEGDDTGILDLLVPDEAVDYEAYELWDYKTAGSFKVAKALGLVGKKVPEPNGEVYKSSGKWGKAGTPKMVTVWERDPATVDMWEWEYQDNNYRLKIEACGFPISKMFNQITVRDGGTITATNRGITENIYKIPIRRLPDEQVREYFRVKREALLGFLSNGKFPPPCNNAESWNGRRCKGFCDVAEFCDVGIEARKEVQ
jgi:hypothetical protein